MTDETWKTAPGFPGYEVSDRGRVRRSEGGQGTKGGVIKPVPNDRGYKVVALRKDGKTSTPHVHSLVARAFLKGGGNGMTVQHKNHNKGDNRVSNLEWAKASDNYGEGRLSPMRANAAKRLLRKGMSVSQVAAKLKLKPGVVKLIKNRMQ